MAEDRTTPMRQPDWSEGEGSSDDQKTVYADQESVTPPTLPLGDQGQRAWDHPPSPGFVRAAAGGPGLPPRLRHPFLPPGRRLGPFPSASRRQLLRGRRCSSASGRPLCLPGWLWSMARIEAPLVRYTLCTRTRRPSGERQGTTLRFGTTPALHSTQGSASKPRRVRGLFTPCTTWEAGTGPSSATSRPTRRKRAESIATNSRMATTCLSARRLWFSKSSSA
jgi:hypothetical protein